MGNILVSSVKSVGTSSVQVLAEKQNRSVLLIQNKHASQTVRVKFGSAIQGADVTEVQLITFSNVPTFGVYKIKWNGLKTAAINYSDNAAAVQTALRLVTGLGSVTVAGDTTVGFTVTMTAATPAVDADLPLLEVTDSTLEIAAVTEVQTLTFSAVPDSGSFKLNYGLLVTGFILFSDNAAAVQTALRLLAGLGSVTVSGDYTGGFVITFTGVVGDATALVVSDNTLLLVAVPVTTMVVETTKGVAEALTTTLVAETTKGKYADGYVIPAANGVLNFIGEDCPIDPVFMLASGADTRVEIQEG